MKKLLLFLLLCFTPLLFAENGSKSLFLSYEELPSKLYVGQLVPLKIKAIVTNPQFDTINAQFGKAIGTEVTNPNSKWELLETNTYETTFNVKILAASAQIPSITVNLMSKNQSIEKEVLMIAPLQAIQLKKEPSFSNVLAKTLSINKYKTTSYDTKNVMIVLEIEATGANLKDFNLSQIQKNGVDSYSENNGTQKIYYYAIIPNYQKTFEFTYFDLLGNKFHKISLPVVIENEEVSAQVGINPKESVFEFYKSVAYAVGGVLFFLHFLRKRKLIFFLPVVAFGLLFFLDQNPLNNVQLKANSILTILPSERSTIFFTSTQNAQVEKLAEYEDFIKVLLPDGKVGWTKRENIIKN